jgi:hypothetical protein
VTSGLKPFADWQAHERDQQLVSAEFLGLRKEVVAVLDRRCRLVERGIEIPLPSGEP